MQLKLRVSKGSSQGKEIPITRSRFMIGRGDDCQLRPHSDVISRNHCCIVVEGGRVYLDDMGSKNGSYVNGERVEGRAELRNGDDLRIGPLEFVVLLESGVGGAKREPVADIHDAANRSAGRDASDSGVIGDWLTEGDQEDRAKRIADPETRQFKLDETDRVALEATAEEDSDTKTGKGKPKKKKKEPGKLPPLPDQQAASSRDAAAEMLRKLFNRG